MIFINGIGAIGGPLLVGWMMTVAGPPGFFLYIAIVAGFLTAFAVFRMIRRPSSDQEQLAAFTPVSQSSSPVAVDMAQEHAIDIQESGQDEE